MSPQLLTQAEPALKSKNNPYRGKSVIETLTNGYFIVDNNWRVKYWNVGAEKLLGINGQDLIGKNLWDSFAAYVPKEFHALYSKASVHDIPGSFREYWEKMGAWFEVKTWYTENTLSFSFKTSPPIDEENAENAHERLKTITELYKFVTEITNDSLWEWDLSSEEIFWIDGGHKRSFGYSIENMLVPVSFWKKCIHPDDRKRVWEKLNLSIQNEAESLWEDEYRFKKENGDYIHVCDRGHIVRDENNKATRIIGATQDIDKRVELENELANQKSQHQQEITNAIMTALENERSIMGTEIQDNLAQIMAATKLHLELTKMTEVNRESNINKSIIFTQEVIGIMRKISKTLIIPPPHIISLLDNIKVLIADTIATNPIAIELRETGMSTNDLPLKWQINIFRIIQEQINNILRHSEASRVVITLSNNDRETSLMIADNGKGHDIMQKKDGVGIINIRTRVELCGGTLSINSSPGKGYELKASFKNTAENNNGREDKTTIS